MSEIDNTIQSTEEPPKQDINDDSSQDVNEESEANPSSEKVHEDQSKESEIWTIETIGEEEDKWAWRRKVWVQMKMNKFDSFPTPSFGRIPNFKGLKQATSRLTELEEFVAANSIEVHPERNLELIRRAILRLDKELYVVTPQYDFSFLKKFVQEKNADSKRIATHWGVEFTGVPMKLRADIHLDMMVIGSVAVTTEGHRIGKGYGYTDLEYAILNEMGVLDDKTVIVTLVHDCQIMDEMPKDMFHKYDIPVDIIVTPTQTIRVEPRMKRPDGVYWNLITRKRMRHMPVLHHVRDLCIIKDKDVGLKMHQNQEKKPVDPNDVTSRAFRVKTRRPKHCDYSLNVLNMAEVTLSHLKNILTDHGIRPTSIHYRGQEGICYLHYTIKDKITRETKEQEEAGLSEIKLHPYEVDDVVEILKNIKITPESTVPLEVEVVFRKDDINASENKNNSPEDLEIKNNQEESSTDDKSSPEKESTEVKNSPEKRIAQDKSTEDSSSAESKSTKDKGSSESKSSKDTSIKTKGSSDVAVKS